jgi:outer membrane immunogenic protein
MLRLSIALMAAASTIAFTQIASAGDIPMKAPVYAPPASPVFSWTGFYIGANAGYGWGPANAIYVAPGPPNGFLPIDQGAVSANGSASLDPKGFVGGGQIGYNWQFAPTSFLGVEADFQAFNLSDSFDGTFTTSEATPHITHTKVDADWLFTLRGRSGYALDRLLVYGTGGLAVAKVNFEQTNSFPGLAPTDSFSLSDTRSGWTVGGGVEYAFWDNWSVKAEYLYVDLGNISGTSTTPGIFVAVLPIQFSHNTDFKANIVRGGINYRFN